MDNRGDDFPGGPPPGRNNNNNLRGGSGLPNLFSPGLRGAIDPQYAAALDFEELRIRRQLEVQQDIELRRRLMEEQQHQLLSELEYRNKIHQLQELQELQAQQRQQAQQQGLSQLLAQNPGLLELQQQQQYPSARDNSLLASLRDDFLLQRHQEMLQNQMQQQLQEQITRDSQQHEQEELLAMLQASGNLRGVLPQDVAALRREELLARQPSTEQPPAQPKPPPRERPPPAPAAPAPTRMDHLINSSVRQLGSSTPIHQDRAYSQADESSAKKRSIDESASMNGKVAPQDPPMPKKLKPATESPPKTKPSPSSSASSKEKMVENKASQDKAMEEKAAEILASQKMGATKPKLKEKQEKDKAVPEKKGRKKKAKVEVPPPAAGTSKKVGRKKKVTVASEVGKATPSKKDGQKDIDSNLSDHEKSVINFLGSRGAKNGTMKRRKANGVQTATEKKGQGTTSAKGRSDDEAAGIVLDFKNFNVSKSEVRKAEKWNRENQPLTTTYPVVAPEDVPFFSPGLKFNIPSLPIEPDLPGVSGLTMSQILAKKPAASQAAGSTKGDSSTDGSKGVDSGDLRYLRFQKRIFKPKKPGKGQDEWWPSQASIRKERRKIGERQDEEDSDDEADVAGKKTPGINFVKAGVEAANERLERAVEPGVLEKLPHCRLYDEYCKEEKKNATSRFCCQTTETFPSEVMVCCSVCSSWRHAQCGGHYKRYTADNTDPSNMVFEPICDQCYLEKPFIEGKPVASKRIDRQRTEHLRRSNATNAVMRQVAFGKHSGQYKWPLGSVSISHISGHTRSVQARHEKAEKQWSDMATRLGNGTELRPRERQRIRTRELERLLVSVEDAEGAMDRHNMMLFLQNDTSKVPAGFEKPRTNIFDPEEDQVYVSLHHGSSKSDKNPSSRVEQRSSASGTKEPKGAGQVEVKEMVAKTLDGDKKLSADANKDVAYKTDTNSACCREGCNKKPRFDSIFCSDSCGVATMETDVLRTLQYASKLHPSVLRS